MYKILLTMSIAFIITLTSITSFLLLKGIRSPTTFTCLINLVQHNSASTSNLLINYTFEKKEGYIGMDGNIKMNDGREQQISRRIFFTFNNNGKSYFLHSIKNIKSPTDNTDENDVNKLFPLFFLESNKEIYLKIKKQNNGQYLFFIDPITTYICKEN